MNFTFRELDLLIDALARAASRYESMANYSPSSARAGQHDKTAGEMRRLRAKIIHYHDPSANVEVKVG